MNTIRAIMALAALAIFASCDVPSTPTTSAVSASGPTTPTTLSVTHIDTQIHGYAQAPAWFVRVRYQTTSTLPHVIIESQALYNGQMYGTVRAVDLSRYEYDVFYDGAAPSGRQIRVYPAEVVGANWHNGVAWINHDPFPAGVTRWHLDISWPDVYLHQKAGTIVQADYTAAVSWHIDVSPQSVVTVSIP